MSALLVTFINNFANTSSPGTLIPILIAVPTLISAIALCVIAFRNMKQHISHNVDGHSVEIITQLTSMQLVIDGKVVDELRSYHMSSAKLQGTFDDKQIVVNIGVGALRPKIITFINGERVNELSNC